MQWCDICTDEKANLKHVAGDTKYCDNCWDRLMEDVAKDYKLPPYDRDGINTA